MSVCDVRDALTKVFLECDTDRSGFIDAKEVEAALRKCTQTQGCKEKWDDARIKQETERFLSHADKNKDQKVSQQEFLDHYAPLLSKQQGNGEEKRPDQSQHHSGDGHMRKGSAEEKCSDKSEHQCIDSHLTKGNAEAKRPNQAQLRSGDAHLSK